MHICVFSRRLVWKVLQWPVLSSYRECAHLKHMVLLTCLLAPFQDEKQDEGLEDSSVAEEHPY